MTVFMLEISSWYFKCMVDYFLKFLFLLSFFFLLDIAYSYVTCDYYLYFS